MKKQEELAKKAEENEVEQIRQKIKSLTSF